jgi:small subunit ribosomal protein S20
MANTKSAKRAARVAKTREAVNQVRKTRMKTTVKAVEEAIAGGNKVAAAAALKAAEPVLMRTAQANILHKKTASRKVSRLTARVKAMPA